MIVTETFGGCQYDVWLGDCMEYMRTFPSLEGLINTALLTFENTTYPQVEEGSRLS